MDLSFDFFEYYLANGFIDYLITTSLSIIFYLAILSSIRITFTNLLVLDNLITGIMGIIFLLIILTVLIFVWPITDGIILYFLPQFALIFGIYLIIRLVILIVLHHQVFNVLEFIMDNLSSLSESKYLSWIWQFI